MVVIKPVVLYTQGKAICINKPRSENGNKHLTALVLVDQFLVVSANGFG